MDFYIVVSPDAANVTAGDNQVYAAEAFASDNSSLGDVTANTSFSIEPAAGGNWTDNVYTSESAGNWTVTGNYNSRADNATLLVNAGPPDYIIVSPGSANVTAGDNQTYIAEAFDQASNSLGDITANTTGRITSMPRKRPATGPSPATTAG
jgi:hypothetical protein